MATVFKRVENEAYYYHGRIYLRAIGTGWDAASRMNLYLDKTDGILGEDVSGQLLHAARLGLSFGEDAQSRVILRLSEEENPQSQQTYNTVVNGRTLGKNEVLSYQNGAAVPASDPSVSVEDYTISFGNSDMTLPEKPLITMNLNQGYPVDIYFYLEGCDPDCSEGISHNMADIHLAFFGALNQGEAG